MKKNLKQTPKEKLDAAVKLYEDRQSRAAHPSGHTDNAGRWYPSADESCACCDAVRGPSRAYPWSYMIHCRTSKHIEQLLNIPAGSIRAEINRRAREAKAAATAATEYRRTMQILAVAA